MSRIDPHQGLQPSILDRLIDPNSRGNSLIRGYKVEQMEAAVRRDLEDLLNTRQSLGALPEGLADVASSILCYGVPDLVSLNALGEAQQQAIGEKLQSIITQFEPRLRDVRATLVQSDDERSRTIRFRIAARLCLDPAPEVAFDTVLELTTGHCAVIQPDA
jgi:type VI secretion system protein ImpF